MAKPILIFYIPKPETYSEHEFFERFVVKMQEQCSDYHVIGVPRQGGDVEVKVMSAEYVSEYDILEAKQIITQEVNRFYGN